MKKKTGFKNPVSYLIELIENQDINLTRGCSEKLKTLKELFSQKILDIRPPPFLLLKNLL